MVHGPLTLTVLLLSGHLAHLHEEYVRITSRDERQTLFSGLIAELPTSTLTELIELGAVKEIS